MANQRSKERQQANISFTKVELAKIAEYIKTMKVDNRSDFVRNVLKDWFQQREAHKKG